jgi:hypothetical protein
VNCFWRSIQIPVGKYANIAWIFPLREGKFKFILTLMYEVTEQKLQQSSLPVYKLLPRIQLQLEHHQTIPLETSSQSILIF